MILLEEIVDYEEIKKVIRVGAEANADTLHELIKEVEAEGYRVFHAVVYGNKISVHGTKDIEK